MDSQIEVSEGVTHQDILNFCEKFEYKFERMGCPDNWDDTETFWVSYVDKISPWNAKSVGSRVQMDKVRQWKQGEIKSICYKNCGQPRAHMLLPKNWTEEDVEKLDSFLRNNEILNSDQKIVFRNFLDKD